MTLALAWAIAVSRVVTAAADPVWTVTARSAVVAATAIAAGRVRRRRAEMGLTLTPVGVAAGIELPRV
ncbi:hypothetical protein GCM10018781_27490 [Kitasatospora indigofera]|uniref:Uncharacterized protein n=1 Tax=Kitasatospora indigofera TaxID=67307 RepID=A0A919KR37_9ACTN|nr:hypothetical protein GCM10018781_27490 [Kitasatospora indigofera]